MGFLRVRCGGWQTAGCVIAEIHIERALGLTGAPALSSYWSWWLHRGRVAAAAMSPLTFGRLMARFRARSSSPNRFNASRYFA